MARSSGRSSSWPGLVVWLEAWEELVGTLARNPVRTGLTAAGVAWGMFLLVLLTGFGAGLEGGVQRSLGRQATNAVFFWGRTTSLPYKGTRPGRPVKFDNSDTEAILQSVEGVAHLAPRNQLGGWRGQSAVQLDLLSTSASVTGEVPAFAHISPMDFVAGRYINPRDLEDRRRVAVVGMGVAEELAAPGQAPESLVGRLISIDGSWFSVVGVFRSRLGGEDGDRVEQGVHLPLSTFQQSFRMGDRVRWFAVAGTPERSAEALETEVRGLLASRHRVHPEDLPAIGSRNGEAQYRRMQATFAGIRGFVLLVGAMTLLAGAFGVTNVMLVSVGERTRELGLRRALGATRRQVRSMILRESLLLTVVAGQLGLIVGVGVLELARAWQAAESPLGAPHVDAPLVVVASVLMGLAGLVAGFLPASRAAEISPVEALRGG